MLSVQSVNLRPAFGGYRPNYDEVEDVEFTLKDEYYPKDSYVKDKSALEEHLAEINKVIEDKSIPKPVRVFGKLVSVGIGSVLGFVSMKYGAQGMAKLIRKGAAWLGKLKEKTFFENAAKKFAYAKGQINEICTNVYNSIMDSKLIKASSEFFVNIGKKYKETKLATSISEFNKSKPARVVFEGASKVKDGINGLSSRARKYVSQITEEQVEKGVVNLFAFSGGVTGGVTALQDVTKD